MTITANEAVRAQPDNKPALNEAEVFLREELADGPKAASAIKKAATEAGLSWATIRRAQEKLKIKPKKTSLTDGWQWELTGNRGEDAQRGS